MSENSIALSPPVLEGSGSLAVPKRVHGPLHAARLRLLVAIPVVTVVWGLAVGSLGYEVLTTLEGSIPSAEFAQAQLTFVVGLLLILAFALMTGWALARAVLSPLRELAEQVNALAKGDAAAAVPVGDNEIGDLSAKFNTMLGSLQDQARAQSQVIMEHFTGALITVDGQGRVTALNTAAAALLDVTSDAARGRLLNALLPKEARDLAEALLRVLQDGQSIPRQDVSLGKPDGSAQRLTLRATVKRGPAGEVQGAVFNLRDSDRIEAFQERMKQTEQFAAISTFAAGVAHEIRNPLASIKGAAQLLSEDLRADDRRGRYTRVIEAEVNRLDHIVMELQAFTHSRTELRDACDLSIILQEALELARLRLQPDAVPPPVALEGAASMRVRGHAEHLLQALFHVILNALEAAAGHGEVTIRASRDHVPPTAILEIENTGSQVADEDRERIFTPFFSTKAAGPGLGLAVARQILYQHQGSISVHSDARSVVFRITLPIAASDSHAPEAAA